MPSGSPGTLSYLMSKILLKFQWNHLQQGRQIYNVYMNATMSLTVGHRNIYGTLHLFSNMHVHKK